MEWRKINDFPNYSVSDEGQIRNDKTGTIRTLNYTYDGYAFITIKKNGKTYAPQIHRLVLQAFCPNENSSLQVNHINGDRKDNRLINLEWLTQQENLQKRNFDYVKERLSRPIIVKYIDGKIEEYPSVRECGRQLGISKDTVLHYITHKLSAGRKIQAIFSYKDAA